ncbi:hypothetical protein JHW43_007353 [Diplocarpon mali]|nr:hypothetical protein JHW43_007353 [Diplocarpon mali]
MPSSLEQLESFDDALNVSTLSIPCQSPRHLACGSWYTASSSQSIVALSLERDQPVLSSLELPPSMSMLGAAVRVEIPWLFSPGVESAVASFGGIFRRYLSACGPCTRGGSMQEPTNKTIPDLHLRFQDALYTWELLTERVSVRSLNRDALLLPGSRQSLLRHLACCQAMCDWQAATRCNRITRHDGCHKRESEWSPSRLGHSVPL